MSEVLSSKSSLYQLPACEDIIHRQCYMLETNMQHAEVVNEYTRYDNNNVGNL